MGSDERTDWESDIKVIEQRRFTVKKQICLMRQKWCMSSNLSLQMQECRENPGK